MFTGIYEFNVDNKGRLSVPAKFRDILKTEVPAADHLIVTRGLDNCLFVFPPQRWAELREKLLKLPMAKKGARFMVRFILGTATECAINDQGRINVPTSLLKAAAIGKEVVIMGVGNRIEIWDKDQWNKYEADNMDYLNELEELGI